MTRFVVACLLACGCKQSGSLGTDGKVPDTAPPDETDAPPDLLDIGFGTHRYDAQRSGVASTDPMALTGNEVWRYSAGAKIHVGPVVAGDYAFVKDVKGRVHALSVDTGERRWVTEVGVGVGSGNITVDGGFLYVGVGGALVALVAETGALLWQTPVLDGGFSQSVSAPVMTDECVLFGVIGLHCLDPETGDELWERKTGAQFGVVAPVAALGSTYFAGAKDSAGNGYTSLLIAVRDGKEIWRKSANAYSGATRVSPAAGNGRVCASMEDLSVRCFDVANGGQLWSATPSTGVPLESEVAVTDQAVYTRAVDSSEKLVVALDAANGNELWVTRMGGDRIWNPVLVGDDVVVVTERGTVVGLDAADGVESWRLTGALDYRFPFAVVEDALIGIGKSQSAVVAVR